LLGEHVVVGGEWEEKGDEEEEGRGGGGSWKVPGWERRWESRSPARLDEGRPRPVLRPAESGAES
jgi:hypothetical protein